MKVKIDVRFPSLNEYISKERANRFIAAGMKKKYNEIVAEAFKGIVLDPKPIWITFRWFERNMRRDKDNVAFGKKFILDGMQAAGTIKNDNNKYIAGFTDEFVYGNGDGVEVEIDYDDCKRDSRLPVAQRKRGKEKL